MDNENRPLFFPLAVSFFWMSGTCQSCSNGVAETSGKMIRSSFQWKNEQGNSGNQIHVIWSDQSLPMTINQAAHVRPFQMVPTSYLHLTLAVRSQLLSFIQTSNTWTECQKLNCSLGLNKSAQVVHHNKYFHLV